MWQNHQSDNSCVKKYFKRENGNRPKSTKKAKIIVRNLPFKNLSEKTLEDLFSEFGEIEEVKLLRKPDGKFIGCGFVQFQKVSSAAKAIKGANQREINGRKIILDWALPKDNYLEKVKKLQEQELLNQKVKIEKFDKEDIDKDDIKVYIDKKPDTWASESENENETETETEGEGEDVEYKARGKNELLNDAFHPKLEKKEVLNKKINQKDDKSFIAKKKLNESNDAEDGRTVFIRNIPFSATNDDLKECVKNYGPIEYALICIDKLTEHSKGTAFVKFKSEESAKQCIRDSDKIFIDETPLNVINALTKENLENRKSLKKTVKDSRNLYLVREGVVLAGSKAAIGVSASDMSKRLQLEQWKSQILKNLNMFVSRTRLVIHNLPPHYEDETLRQLFHKYGNPKAVIKEAKVMWEKNKLNAEGKRISKEVGFVSFADHEDALLALRNINNNPKIFTSSKRPIVAFSIENRAVINQRLKRIEKSRAKLGVTIDEKLSKLNRKQRRFIRRRQKLIEKRREAKKLKGVQEMGEKNCSDSFLAERNKNKARCSNDEGKSNGEKQVPKKKRKFENEKSDYCPTNKSDELKTFAGVTSEPGKKIKLRSRFNLKKQASLHNQMLKKEKIKKKMQKERKGLEPIKLPKQKMGKRKSLMDDAKLSRLLREHRENISNSSILKKWYET